jgi:hypothetical protein
MEYLIGIIVALATAASGKLVGFGRDRAFYPTVLIVTATYYILFAAMGAGWQTLVIEMVFASAFFVLAVIGFKRTIWVVIAGFVAHGVFDLVRSPFISNPGVPRWWPGFCMAYDVALGAMLVAMVRRRAGSRAFITPAEDGPAE